MLSFLRQRYIQLKIVTSKCGHKGPKKGRILLYELDKNGDLTQEYCELTIFPNSILCINCIETRIIRCAKCGTSILPDDDVSIYFPNEGDYIPDYAVTHKFYKGQVSYIACCNKGCCSDSQESKLYLGVNKDALSK